MKTNWHDQDTPVYYEYSNRITLNLILALIYCAMFIASLLITILITLDLMVRYTSEVIIPVFMMFLTGLNAGIMIRYIIKILHGEKHD